MFSCAIVLGINLSTCNVYLSKYNIEDPKLFFSEGAGLRLVKN